MKFKAMGLKNGKKVEKIIIAESRDQAFLKMKNEQFSNISIVEKGSFFSRKRIGVSELSILFRQLATFSKAGESFNKSLASVADVTRNQNLKEILLDIKRNVECGESVPASFSKYKCFPVIVINLLKVGDAAGEMPKTLDELANYLEQINTLEKGVDSALIYPKMILIVMVLAMSYVVANVLPQFRAFYTDMHIEMPLITKCLYAFSDFLNNDWMIAIPSFLCIFYFLKNTKKYIPDIHDQLCIKLPVIKGIMKNLYMFRFCKTMQILMSSNVPIIQTLKLTADTMENHLYADVIQKTIPLVKAGEGITSSIRRNDTNKVFDVMTIAFLSTGEETDNISELLLKASDYYKKVLNTEIDNFPKKIEPVLLIFIAIFVFALVASVYLPVFRMSQIANQQN